MPIYNLWRLLVYFQYMDAIDGISSIEDWFAYVIKTRFKQQTQCNKYLSLAFASNVGIVANN